MSDTWRRTRRACLERLTYELARRRNQRWVEASFRAANIWRAAVENKSYRFDRNGEEWLLSQLPEAPLVFDVGANVGDWTSFVTRVHPGAQVHAFELVPETAERLALRFASDRRVVVNAVGLSDSEGIAEVNYFADAPSLSSLVQIDHRAERTSLEVPVTTGDRYCASVGVERIDLLKVDAEGADLRVLRGFERMFDEGRIDMVQFEYGFASIRSRDLLADFYEFLEGHDFRIGKLFPNFVRFRPYSMWLDEDFLGANYVASAVSG